MNRLHIKGITENKINASVIAKISLPMPAINTFKANDNSAEVGFNKLIKLVRVRRNIFANEYHMFLIKNTDIE